MADPKPTDQTPETPPDAEELARRAALRDDPAGQAGRMHQEQEAREAEETDD